MARTLTDADLGTLLWGSRRIAKIEIRRRSLATGPLAKRKRMDVNIDVRAGHVSQPPSGAGIYCVRVGHDDDGAPMFYVGKSTCIANRLTHTHHRWSEVRGCPAVFVIVNVLDVEDVGAERLWLSYLEHKIERAIQRTTNGPIYVSDHLRLVPEATDIAAIVVSSLAEIDR